MSKTKALIKAANAKKKTMAELKEIYAKDNYYAATVEEAEALMVERLPEMKKMTMYGLTFDQVCMVVGVEYQHFLEVLDKNHRVASYLRRGRGQSIAKVTETAYELATSGKNPGVTMWWLKTRAGWEDQTQDQPRRVEFRTVIDESGIMEQSKKVELETGEIIEAEPE